MSGTGPILETERLLLRPPLQEDLDGWAVMMADEESSRFEIEIWGQSREQWRASRQRL